MYTNLEPTQLLNFSLPNKVTFYNVFLIIYASYAGALKSKVSRTNLHLSAQVCIFLEAENLNKLHAVFFLYTTQQTPPRCFLSRILTFTKWFPF